MPAKLSAYNEKRDFNRTSEPEGVGGEPAGRLRFLVQHHLARRDHYDLRLEWDGVLLELGGAQGALVQPARQAAGRARGGPSAGVPQLRGNHSAGRVRRRHGDALGRGVLGTARRRRGGPARRRAEVRAGRPAPQGRLGARAAEAQGGRARRQLAPHQGEGRARAGRAPASPASARACARAAPWTR